VIQMLTDMTAKAQQEKKAEQVAYAEFNTWCGQESANLASSIKKSAEEIDMLSASINQLESEISELGDDIAQLHSDEDKFASDIAATKQQRVKDHADFLAEEQDFSESVDAIERALAILAKQDYDRPAASAALLQVSSVQQLPEKARSVVTAFMGLLDGEKSPLGGTDYSAPEANAYEFQSGGIITILKKLRDEFRTKLADRQKEEMNSQHASDMIITDLTDSLENAEKERGRKTRKAAKKSEKRSLEAKQMKGTSSVKAEDEKTLAETNVECKEKSLSFEEKQKLRTEEIEALQKATEILESPEVSGNADKYLDLAQKPSATVLLQAAGGASEQGVHRRIRDFLAAEGQRLHSQSLTLLSQKIMADPFAKVKKMIDTLLKRLLEEANEDAKHEGFCDEEMGKSKVTRNKLSSDIDALTASIEDGQATISTLTADTAQLSKDIAALDEAMSKATALRKEEKATNAVTVKDAQAAQAAVAAATAVLKDYYAKALTATALLQQKAPSPREWGLKTRVKMGTEEWDALANPNFQGQVDKGHKEDMQTFGDTEKGQQDEAQYGVLGLLEVIASDFATLEANTNAAEATAAEAYERFMVDSRRSKAAKTRKIELNTSDKIAAQAKVQEETADLKSTQDQLLAADRYHDRLVPQCIDRGMTWDERVAARQAEIDSLKQALAILGSSDVA